MRRATNSQLATRACAIALPFTLWCAGCSGPTSDLAPIASESVLKQPKSETPVPKKEMEDFALRFTKAALQESSEPNFLVSPFSVSVAMSMLLNGAQGETKETIAKLIGTDAGSLPQWNRANLALMQQLMASQKVDLAVANSLWTFEGQPPKQSYLDTLKTSYGAEGFSLADRSAASLDQINDWTSTNTRGRIPKILDRLTPAGFAVLVNALSFDGPWFTPFEKDRTAPGEFTLATGELIQVPMMHADEVKGSGIRSDDGTAAFRIPYVDPDYHLLLVMPPTGTSPVDYVSAMDPAKFADLESSLRDAEISISIPKLKAESTISLKPVLTRMGAGSLFEPGNDFGAMLESSLDESGFISQAVHKTFIEWDEEGTKAAAATAVEVLGSIAFPLDRFDLNRPFAYFLLHIPTKTILFIGTCNDPR